jgi:hypothetical protein
MATLYETKCKKCDNLITQENATYNNHYLRSTCRECQKKYLKNYYGSTSSVEKRQIMHYKSRYNIDLELHRKLSEQQNGMCAICGVKPDNKLLSLDHNHKTGEIRGLLCNNCNVALGNLREDESIILNMLEYLRKYNLRKVS